MSIHVRICTLVVLLAGLERTGTFLHLDNIGSLTLKVGGLSDLCVDFSFSFKTNECNFQSCGLGYPRLQGFLRIKDYIAWQGQTTCARLYCLSTDFSQYGLSADYFAKPNILQKSTCGIENTA